jgi:hypothetical protein
MFRPFIATQKELNKEFIAKFEKMDALCENVDNLAKDFIALKNFVQRQRFHEYTMKYLEEVLEKSWETVKILEARQKQEERLERLEKRET